MNTTIARIGFLRERIDKLDKMIKNGECFAAGVTIEITIGANSDRGPLVLDFGCYSDIAGILQTMRQGIVDSINANLKNAERDFNELGDFIAGEKS
jgi:hypothetical protein